MHLGQTPIIGLKTTMAAPDATKTQWIRLSDVLVIGPAMIYGAVGKRLPEWIKVGMVLAGVATIGANLAQFITIQRSQMALTAPKTGSRIPRLRTPTQ